MKDTIDNSRKTLESVITFRQGKTTIDNSQLPNIERIATYLKNHKEASVVIKGYASPEGSVEVNERLAQQRAEIVKKNANGQVWNCRKTDCSRRPGNREHVRGA